MTCTKNSSGFFQWTDQVPISFTEWKSILSNFTTKELPKLSSSSDPHHRSTSQTKKQERSLPKNQVFGDSVLDSFIVSSSSNILQSTIGISRQDVPKILSPPTKRYVSSFKTLLNSTNNKQTQRLNYISDSVVILRLSKEHTSNSNGSASQSSSKQSSLSMTTTTTTTTATVAKPSPQQQSPSSPGLSPILKVEGQKRRIVHHDSVVIAPDTVDMAIASRTTNYMPTSTSNPAQTNSSVFTYRSAAAGGNTVRQRAIAETTTNNLLISTERLKTNMSSSIRSTRQPLTSSTTISSTYISSQQVQRNINQNSKSRLQQDKQTNSREIYEYPDPFTNCPQDILSKLAQLTKLQLETIDWEKKKRFIKKKPLTNGTVQGKDSP